MPVNKNALIRYRTINDCLTNRQRRWTLQDLMDACSEALLEFEGKSKVSKRTTQLDIQHMRSGKLGYEAPIVVVDRKYYTYSDPNFSIARLRINPNEVQQLKETLSILKQFTGFQHFEELDGIIKRLEEKIDPTTDATASVVSMEYNPEVKGLHWLSPLHDHIKNEEVVKLTYHSFNQLQPIVHEIHPYHLKAYKQRWYLLGYSQLERRIKVFALDRIEYVMPDPRARFIPNTFFNPDEYFKDIIGVTIFQNSKPTKILMYAYPLKAKFLTTKPIHQSQKCLKTFEDGGKIFQLHLMINFELVNSLASESPDIIILSPITLRNRLVERFKKAIDRNLEVEFRGKLWKAVNQLNEIE